MSPLAAGGCQRTLELVGAPRRATAGQAFALRVRAFDDRGRGVAAAGATVTAQGRGGPVSVTAGADGRAQLVLPAGVFRLRATRAGLVPSFPVTVRAG